VYTALHTDMSETLERIVAETRDLVGAGATARSGAHAPEGAAL
jgi:dihydroorotate dehydrogenase (fumarate)/dihydroorotate dehydrogenase (NAD+) catalytic subunit